MYILHGTWIPSLSTGFVNQGNFCFWVETDQVLKSSKKQHYPYQLKPKDLLEFIEKRLSIKSWMLGTKMKLSVTPCTIAFPTANKKPLPSLEIMRALMLEASNSFTWEHWKVNCIIVSSPLLFLKEINFASFSFPDDISLGSDLRFWHSYAGWIKSIIQKDHYVPRLVCQQIKKTVIHAGWQIMPPDHDSTIDHYVKTMPWCVAAATPSNKKSPPFFDKAKLLHHFSENILHNLIADTPFTKKVIENIEMSLVEDCISLDSKEPTKLTESTWKQWYHWQQQLRRTQTVDDFILGFRLNAPDNKKRKNWILEFIIESKKDPSMKLELKKYWKSNKKEKSNLTKYYGNDLEKQLLMQLGYSTRIYEKLNEGLNTNQPSELTLSIDDAFEFLKEHAWVLQDAGFRVIIPSWWTPKGRLRAKIRLNGKSKSSGSDKNTGQGYFSLEGLATFSYQLSIGGETITPKEWQELVNAKTPLVNFRGQWIELDIAKMQQMLQFWNDNQQTEPELSLTELMKINVEQQEDYDVFLDDKLSNVIENIQIKTPPDVLKTPKGFNGTLRHYQQQGLSWLHHQEHMGLNPCLADDMGLGKTIQIIALLLHEKNKNKKNPPTLLIAPTSVLGNWAKEIERFAPKIKPYIHHGSKRVKNIKDFKKEVNAHDVFITSFSLVRKDLKLLGEFHWKRVVVDEAQNIKNPKSAQTKAILKLKADHRISLTGTPIENRLLDLWSIFNFLNPGFLGTSAQFKKAYEIPVQRDNDINRSTMLKQLLDPFILRRVKTDKSIIKDLPDKVEQKVYCQLTKEQASLYQSIVDNVGEVIEKAEGIERKGIMLATLMKLKQVCNHPSQFLQDDSAFTVERSHKLSRLIDMIEEVMANNESMLIFTQFKEVGVKLEQLLSTQYLYNTLFLHGGTTRKKREQMIEKFQNPDTEASIFILSLKAGGVGITLTRANHVFHFDRWWNPAVENQATDRAYRIGQKKTVFAHKYVTIGTLEERIDQMLEEKQKLADSIVGNGESWLTELDNDAFRKLIELNRDAMME